MDADELFQMHRDAVQAIIEKAEIEATGTCSAPPLDLDAIKERVRALPHDHEWREDLYRLIHEVDKLRNRKP